MHAFLSYMSLYDLFYKLTSDSVGLAITENEDPTINQNLHHLHRLHLRLEVFKTKWGTYLVRRL